MTRGRRLSLRARVALSTACVVAVAIAAISVVAWVTTRDRLHAQVDQALVDLVPPVDAPPPPPDVPLPNLELLCRPAPPDQGVQRFLERIQLLRPDGGSCTPSGIDPVVTSAQDRAVRTTTLRDGRTRSGRPVRVLLRPVGNGSVLVVSRSLTDIEDTLADLREILVVVSLLGGVLAAAASLLLTRRAIAPVARLTAAAEDIARTEDLYLPDTVSGRDEVGRLGRAFAAMIAALQESRRRQRELVDDAAHELRTPLTSLRTNIDLLARSERTGRPIAADQRTKIIDRLQAQAGEFGDLITELVVLARDEHEPAREQVDVHTVVDRAVRRARSRARGHHFDIHCRPWTVVGDAGALERTVLNLLDNAVKFSPATSTVRLRSGPGWITVCDQGPGLPEEHRARAFERFWRAPEARALPGSGLGLAIVADTVEAHGGTVRFAPPAGGRGACVRIELPAS